MGPEPDSDSDSDSGVDDEEGERSSSTLKLPLFSSSIALALEAATMDSADKPGMRTPPLHTSAAVPFRWEEEPGKPKPCTTLITLPSKSDFATHKCLELPPRLLLVDALDHHPTTTNHNHNITKLTSSSPSTVLEGPYYVGRSCRFPIPTHSFRYMGGECYGCFGKSSPETDSDRDQLFGAIVLSSNNSSRLQKDKGSGVFGSWRKKSNSSRNSEVGVGGSSYVFQSYVDRYRERSRDDEGSSSSSSNTSTGTGTGTGTGTSTSSKITRSGSFTTITTTVSPARPRFWASVYGGMKQVFPPWRSRKAKKGGLLG